ncbi:hypothetical protein BFG51_03320 [Dietzia alimentaria]|nr:hypothetical protein BFG51_03320 [Dietzia alimentaria]
MPLNDTQDDSRTVPAEVPKSSRWTWINTLRSQAPGLALCAVATAASVAISSFVPALSPLLIAIILGALLVNTLRIRESFAPGIAFSAKKLLRVGIALLGFQLLLSDIFDLGWGVILTVVAVVVVGISSTVYLGGLLGLSWAQRLLIACGFSICGAAAVAAAESVVDAEEEETMTAIALVVVFGTLMIPVIPLLAAALGLSPVESGIWAGASIHEVAQVVAAGGAIGGGALGVAVIVKLARVLLLAPVIVGIGLVQRRQGMGSPEKKRPPLVPFFIVAFLACVALRSSGVTPTVVVDSAQVAQTVLLTAAMFALGTGVEFSALRKVGPRPIVLAGASTVIVAVVALAGALLGLAT